MQHTRSGELMGARIIGEDPAGHLPPHASDRRSSAMGRLLASIRRPVITQRVLLVGAIPIAIIACVGFLAIILLGRADEAHEGALDVATIYRQVVSGMSAQDAYINSAPADRNRYASAFSTAVGGASSRIAHLKARTSDPSQAEAIARTAASLDDYAALMGRLTSAAVRNDAMTGEMSARLGVLVSLTNEARDRQRQANADIVETLRERNATLVATSRLVDAQQALRSAISDGALIRASRRSSAEARIAVSFEDARIQNAFEQLVEATRDAPATRIAEEPLTAAHTEALSPVGVRTVLDRLDRQLKIDASAQRALQMELSELFAYSVEANETEQATQRIALDTMELGARTNQTISRRQGDEITGIVEDSRALSEEIAVLPISPLIQSDMLDALDIWRDRLLATQAGLRDQNEILVSMEQSASRLLFEVADLNASFSANADQIGSTVRHIIVFGGGMGFLLAAISAMLVARSITGPLKKLERGMNDRAMSADFGPMPDAERSDEIGAMARATNHFLSELDKRERALRVSVARSEETLQRLRDTQSELIQAEKLASLGQLVAGVAHEINTPLGVALTTTTTMNGEVARFQADVRERGVTQEAFDRFVARMADGARLTAANVERSANLVHSFKQVAADRASGERRTFRLDEFTNDLFISLGPMNKRAGHHLNVVAEPGLMLDSYPGALAQVLTNLLSNAYVHAFRDGEIGTIDISIGRHSPRSVRIAFADNGRGIEPENRAKVFDPFYTTGRASGSTGLGLHIVFNLVTATLGGTIALSANSPRGTVFTIDLPLEAPQPRPIEKDVSA